MRSLILSLALISLVATGCSRTELLRQSVMLQADPDMDATEAAIGRALTKRQWVVQDRRPGVIDALYAPRKHKLWVRIVYDDRAIEIQYVRSEGLRESRDGGTIYVHRRVNTRLHNLESDIALALQDAVLEGQPPPGGEPPPSEDSPDAPPPPPAGG